MSEVFLSYSHEDRTTSAAIAEELGRLGVDVWWDHEMLGGEDYRDRISQVLARASAAIVVWSRRSLQSHWVISEAAAAAERQCLIPVSIDGERPPIDFRQLHTIELKGWIIGDPLPAELIRAVSNRLGRELAYDTEARRGGTVARLARQATSGWYLDFESLFFYLVGQGFACFLCELPIPSLARKLSQDVTLPEAGLVSTFWAPYALSLAIGLMVAALYMHPVLETRRLAVAIPIFVLAAALSVFAYQIAGAITQMLNEEQLLIIFGLGSFIFILVTAVADRATRRR